MRMGLDLCCSLRLSNVCLFSDSSLAVQEVLPNHIDLGEEGALILEICQLIKELGTINLTYEAVG